MDRRVEIQSYTTTRDDWNQPNKTWTTLASVWASKHDKRSGEILENQQTVNLNQSTFRIRYRSGLDTSMRILYDSTEYYIIGIRELGRKEGLEVTTESRDE